MALESWLIDKSAYVRLGSSPAFQIWLDRIDRGLVRISIVTALEIGYSFTSPESARRERGSGLLGALISDYVTPAIENRAKEVQLALLDRGQHRAVSIPDLMIAATAEVLGRTVLHVDKDFELISEFTGQPVERLEVQA
jgi:predicted nucleic acid-binding protein